MDDENTFDSYDFLYIGVLWHEEKDEQLWSSQKWMEMGDYERGRRESPPAPAEAHIAHVCI